MDDLASEQGEEEELTKNSKKQKKERKGKRKLDEHNLTKSKKKQKSRSLDDEIDAEVKGETEMDFDDVPSDDDKHDDDFSMSDSDSDEDFQGDDHGPSAKTKVSSSKKADKEVTTKEPKKRGRPKKPKSEVEIAQENFELCEKIFLPLMKKLKDCNFSNDAEKYIKLIAADVDALTPSFIRNHQIAQPRAGCNLASSRRLIPSRDHQEALAMACSTPPTLFVLRHQREQLCRHWG